MIGLILIDIDGTLVGAGNLVPPGAWTAIAAAQASGRKVALCTGRPCAGNAVAYARRVDPLAAHVFQSGAVVCRPDGHTVHSVVLPPLSYARLVGLARAHDQPLEVYTATSVYVERPNEHTRAHAQAIDLDVIERDLLALPGDETIVRVQWIVAWANWPIIEALTAQDTALQISVATHPDLVETCFSSVTARGVSKASAAAWLATHYGLGLEHVAMIGDGDNDLEAVQAAGLGIAMGNGTETVRRAADLVVGTLNHGGLAEAIEAALAW